MGTFFEQNDTLQITRDQGFPPELSLETHLSKPYEAENFKDTLFSFSEKKGIRNYHVPPVRNFLVENRDGKWIYWGTIHILTVPHDYERQITSGTFKLLYLYTPEEMKLAHQLMDQRNETDSFNVSNR